MRPTTRPLLLLAVLLSGLLWAFTVPENDLLQLLTDRLEAYQLAHPQEKVYLHLDKPHYVAGEDVWYKAYLVNARRHVPDSLSKNIYVELISPQGNILLRQMLQVKAGFACGDFDTPDSLATGRYQIRAYTNWMRNFPDDYFFRQHIHIWNRSEADATSQQRKKAPADTLPALTVGFFPEGGNLVAGLSSIVGLKATDRQGKGVAVSGAVVDSTGREITTFQTGHAGLGRFLFVPLPGHTYAARVKTAQGRTLAVAFPPVQARGLTLQVNALFKDKIHVLVSQGAGSGETGRDLLLIGHIRGSVYSSARGKIIQKSLAFSLPKDNLPSGILHLTLFDAVTGEPLLERLVFHQAPDQLRLEIKSDKAQYKARELVQLDIRATTPAGQPAAGHFSLAVTDGALQAEAHPQSLVNYLLLSSDLQGVVEQPGFYFKDAKAGTLQALDNLMLTQGWRRFVWKQVRQTPFEPLTYIPEWQHISVSGQISRLLTNKPLANAEVLLYTDGSQRSMIQTKTNETGRFMVDGLVFDSAATLYVQAKNEKGQLNTTVRLDEVAPAPLRWRRPVAPEAPEGLEAPQAPAPLSEAYRQRMHQQQKLADSYTFRKGERVLQEVQVTARKPVAPPPAPRIYGTANDVIRMDERMPNYGNILQALVGRAAGVTVNGNWVSIRGGGAPLFLLDDVPMDPEPDGSAPIMIRGLHPANVETIEVYKGAKAAVFGTRGSNGVIAVYTKQGIGFGTKHLTHGRTTAQLMGYYKTREFYSPRYDLPKEEHNLPDLRSTLYWNPAVRTDSTGRATIRFYNADQVQSLRVSLEGITPAGLPGSRSQVIGR